MKRKTFSMLDYITMRGDLTFEQSDFNSVDALILCQLTYNNVDGLVSSDFKQKITIEELSNQFESAKNYEERCNMGAMINVLTPQVLQAAAKSRRFSKIRVSGFINKIDEKIIEQFCAVTYQIQKDRYVVVLRGTDDTIAGWYEDFNLGWMDEIPSQKDACTYLHDAMTKLKGRFILAGHSKGGNLSVKAAMSVPQKSNNRLEAVYNFDGPGFFAPAYKTPGYLAVKDRIFSYYPKFCVVGMMFEHPKQYKIVESFADGILQHDPLSWSVLGPQFEAAPDFDEASGIFSSSFNDWAAKLEPLERKRFIDTIFDVIYASGAKTNYEIDQNKIVCGGKMIARLAELSDSDRKAFMHAIKIFVKVAKDNIPMFSVFKPSLPFTRQSL